jgi:hypothetical protein
MKIKRNKRGSKETKTLIMDKVFIFGRPHYSFFLRNNSKSGKEFTYSSN